MTPSLLSINSHFVLLTRRKADHSGPNTRAEDYGGKGGRIHSGVKDDVRGGPSGKDIRELTAREGQEAIKRFRFTIALESLKTCHTRSLTQRWEAFGSAFSGNLIYSTYLWRRSPTFGGRLFGLEAP